MGLSNQWTIIGNLGRDAELRHMDNGDAVLNMSVAVNERVKRGGQYEDAVLWVKVSIFGKRAEALGNLELTKGTKIAAQGPARARLYERRDGQPDVSLDMRAYDIELLGSKPSGQRAQTYGEMRDTPSQLDGTSDSFADDNIPF